MTFAAFLVKPVIEEDLITAIQRVLDRRQEPARAPLLGAAHGSVNLLRGNHLFNA